MEKYDLYYDKKFRSEVIDNILRYFCFLIYRKKIIKNYRFLLNNDLL